MQTECEDYYGKDGCCLICPDAEEGCLCFKCKCTKCFHYTPPEEGYDEKGSCDIATSSRIEANRKRKSISEWAKKDAIAYSRVGLHKEQKTLEFNK